MRTILPVLALIAGCTIEEEDFPGAYGSAVCSRIHECQRTAYEDRYENRSECEDEWAEFGDTILDLGDTFGGTYSPEGAQDCLESIREASCGQFTGSDYTCDVFEESE